MILLLRRIWAFLARDWRLTVSYRMQFFLRILSILIVVTTLFFISRIFTGFTDPRFVQWRSTGGLANRIGRLKLFHDRVLQSGQCDSPRTGAGHA